MQAGRIGEDAAVVADDMLVEALAAGTVDTSDPDPLLAVLAYWRDDLRRGLADAARFGPVTVAEPQE